METALRDALAKAEFQAIKHKDKFRTRTREPKDGKTAHEPQLSRPRNNRMSVAALPDVAEPILPASKMPRQGRQRQWKWPKARAGEGP